MFNKILVPLDGSQLSEHALDPALTLAQRSGAELVFARVPTAEASHEPPTGRQLEVARRIIESYLETTRAAQPPDVKITTLMPEGDVASAIVDTAAAEGIDLIIMSTHGYSGITRWVLGSVTEKVLRSAPCPVLAIRTPAHAIGAPRPIQHVAITLDGSELAERAIEPGLELARHLNADITFVRIAPHAAIDRALDETEHGLSRRMQQDLIDEATAYLAARSTSYSRSEGEIKTEVRVGPAAENILDFVEAYGTDLIVMATHGRTGLQRWVYGSVTAKVLRSANCSLLVIRPAAADLR